MRCAVFIACLAWACVALLVAVAVRRCQCVGEPFTPAQNRPLIPLQIWRTSHLDPSLIPDLFGDRAARFKVHAPWTDEMCVQFLRDEFGPTVADAFRNLRLWVGGGTLVGMTKLHPKLLGCAASGWGWCSPRVGCAAFGWGPGMVQPPVGDGAAPGWVCSLRLAGGCIIGMDWRAPDESTAEPFFCESAMTLVGMTKVP